MRRCTRCNKPNRAESRHCGHCGAALAVEAEKGTDSTMVGGSPFLGVDPMQAAIAEALATARPHTPPGRSVVEASAGTLAGVPVGSDSTAMGMPALDSALAAFRPGAAPERVAEDASTLMMRGPLGPLGAPGRPEPSGRPGPAGAVGSKTLFGMQAAEMQLGLAEALMAGEHRSATGEQAAAAALAGAPRAARVRTRAPVPRPVAPRAPQRKADDYDSSAFDSTPTPDPFRLERGPMTSDTPARGIQALPESPASAPPSEALATKQERPAAAPAAELFRAKMPVVTPAETPRPTRAPRPSEVRGGPIRLPDSDAPILRIGQAVSGALLLVASVVTGAQAFWFRPELGVHLMGDVVPVILGAVALALAAPRQVPIWERSAVGGLGLFTALMLGVGMGAEPFSAGIGAAAQYVMILVGCVGLFLVGVRSIWDPDGEGDHGQESRGGNG